MKDKEIVNSDRHIHWKILQLKRYDSYNIKKLLNISRAYIINFLKDVAQKRKIRRSLKIAILKPKLKQESRMLFYKTGHINSYHPLDGKLRGFFGKFKDNKIDINSLVSQFFQKYPKIPSCELTGKRINLSLGNTYELDHIIPVCKGGESTFENMQIVLSSVNRMKSHYDLDEFITICNLVAKKHPKTP